MFTIYSKLNCSHCKAIENLLNVKSIPYTKKTLGLDFRRKEFIEQFGHTTFPRVVNSEGVVLGGASETVKFLKEEGIL